jgi:hypothetical protein
VLTLPHSRQCGRVDDGDFVIVARIPRRGGRPIPGRDRGPSVGRRSGISLGEILIGDADNLDLDVILDGNNRLGVDRFGRCPDGLDRSVCVVLGSYMSSAAGWDSKYSSVVAAISSAISPAMATSSAYSARISRSPEKKLHEHRGVVDADGAQQFGRRIEVPFRTAGEDLPTVGVGDELLEQRRRQGVPSVPPIRRRIPDHRGSR